MSNLIYAMTSNDTVTLNGMPTNSTSSNKCLDLFFSIGAMRGQDKTKLINNFILAFHEDPLTAIKILFWVRDAREGAGERQIFKDILVYLANKYPDVMLNNINLIPDYGRWDDLLDLIGTKLENKALEVIKAGITDNNALCAKWLPRPNVKNAKRKLQANIIRKYLDLTPKEYRGLLVNLSNTVEQLMCKNNWSAIDYSKIPSKAMSGYMKSFKTNDTLRFNEYLAQVKAGSEKINAGAVYPYDIIKNLKHGISEGADVQWNALPNYMSDSEQRLLPVVDVSGSMDCKVGDNQNLTCMDVAISLGLYISERNLGIFKDSFITFSQKPKIQTLAGSLSERYAMLSRAEWGYNTNILATFNLILDSAVKFNIQPNEMPTSIIILSDMEFDLAGGSDLDKSIQENINNQYAKHNYVAPKIIYWNIQAKSDNFPVKFGEFNTSLISGFSPAILKNVLKGDNLTPLNMMMSVINSDRYSAVTV